MFTWSEQPYKDMWSHLNFLGKKDNCKKLLKGQLTSGRTFGYLNGSILDRKVDQVAMCINQAYEYFCAADEVSINTSPVLFFYGMLSLAKALIVANKVDVFLEDINYHGLHSRPITPSLKIYKDNSSVWCMENEYAVTHRGVFQHLTDVLDNITFDEGCIFDFKNLLSICPEISEMYEKYYNEPSRVLNLYDIRVDSLTPYKVSISTGETDLEKIYSRIPEFQTEFIPATNLLHSVARTFISNNLSGFPIYLGTYTAYIGGRYIVGGVSYTDNLGNQQKRYVSPAIADYIAMYVLSMCARYKQDFWGNIIDGKISGVLGLINLYISVIKRRFPNIILDNLFNEDFRYGSPGHWM